MNPPEAQQRDYAYSPNHAEASIGHPGKEAAVLRFDAERKHAGAGVQVTGIAGEPMDVPVLTYDNSGPSERTMLRGRKDH